MTILFDKNKRQKKSEFRNQKKNILLRKQREKHYLLHPKILSTNTGTFEIITKIWMKDLFNVYS